MHFLFQAIRENASKNPTHVAVRFGTFSTTYAELLSQIISVEMELATQGVGPGDLVGICLPRGLALVPALLGTLRRGASFVPLDPAFPTDRLTAIAEGINLRIALCDEDAPALASGVRRVMIDRCLNANLALSLFAAPETTSLRNPDRVVYLMHTSGSTGVPKGVQVTASNLENLLEAMQARFQLDESSRWLAVTTISFDISVLELLLPMLAGGTLVIASNHDIVDGYRLGQLVETSGITHLQATPATWRMMRASGWEGHGNLTALCGGEAMDPTFAQDLAPRVKSLWNMYGPTETTIWSTCVKIRGDEKLISVGHPIENTLLKILDEAGDPVRAGEKGELLIGGTGVSKGYADEKLNEGRFVIHAGPNGPIRYYRTGDIASFGADGNLHIHGRSDDQIKRNGFRIELGDINAALCGIESIRAARTVLIELHPGQMSLFAFCQTEDDLAENEIRAQLVALLPQYMIPDRYVVLREMPLSPNGKIDGTELKRLAASLARDEQSQSPLPSGISDHLIALVRSLTGRPDAKPSDNLFELGLRSIDANILAARISEYIGRRFPVASIFETPRVDQLVTQLSSISKSSKHHASSRTPSNGGARQDREPIAIIGLALRVPGAQNEREFWDIVSSGRDAVTRFSPREDDPCVPKETREHPNYIRARGMIPNPDLFDAKFFGISPNEARVMDPQQRVFLELAWEALENAGYTPEACPGIVSVYAGMGNNFYYYHNVATNPDIVRMVGEVQVEVGREKDHIATLVSHKLNLKGPSISVHTACSTGLVAIDIACHSLMSGQSDVAIAGAIELCTPQMSGQIGEPGGIFTEDGFCRPFSADATGTMFSDGAGIVVLKRLSDAIADGDRIVATIAATAVNHDGSQKKSYLAPNSRAQAEVIRLAQARAGIDPHTIGYMEAHGTATPVGDPIEFEALWDAFGGPEAPKATCALGSIKANLGHPTTAAGVVGVIKAALILKNQVLPPLANFAGEINPRIALSDSPFYIPATATPWQLGPWPRRAGVSSFGFCGTNAHAVLEESPRLSRPGSQYGQRDAEVLLLSARSAGSLQRQVKKFEASGVCLSGGADLARTAFTLAQGRVPFSYRSYAVAGGNQGAVRFSDVVAAPVEAPKLAFLFPGQGSQYVGMGRLLAIQEPVFCQSLAQIADELRATLSFDIRDVMWGTSAALGRSLDNTHFTQPSLFALELALADFWRSIGLEPAMLVGHSVGEYTAAVLAGVMRRQDAAYLVCRRAALMAAATPGEMLAVRLSTRELLPLLPKDVEVAVFNGETASVVGGTKHAITEFNEKLSAAGHRTKLLKTSHAFHTSSMQDAADAFSAEVAKVSLRAPQKTIVSTLTGTILTADDACSPDYWARQIREPVNYLGAVKTVWGDGAVSLLEVGPGSSLSRLAVQTRVSRPAQRAMASIGSEPLVESSAIAEAIGKLWSAGHGVDWPSYFHGRVQQRIALPTYDFDRESYWLTPGKGHVIHSTEEPISTQEAPFSYEPTDLEVSTIVEDLRQIFGHAVGGDFLDVSENASFFDEGLDSLILTQIIFMIKECYGVTVRFRDLSQTLNSLGSLAQHIHGELEINDAERDASIVPVTSKQHAMLQRMGNFPQGKSVDLARATIKFGPGLHLERLKRAISDLAGLHQGLRMCLTPDHSGWQQATFVPTLVIEDAGSFNQNPPAISVPDFDLGGPLWSVRLYKDADGHSLELALSGLICDGWSLDVIIEDLAALYSGKRPGDAPVPMHLRGDRRPRLVPYRNAENAVHASHLIPALEFRALQDQARGNRCSNFVALLTHVFLSLRSACPTGDVGIYISIAGQPAQNAPRLVANCVDAVPISLSQERLEFQSASKILADLLADAQDAFATDAPHREEASLPLEPSPLVGQFVHIKSLSDAAQEFSGLRSQYALHPASVLETDFQIIVLETTENLELTFSYRESLGGNPELLALFTNLLWRLSKVSSPINDVEFAVH